MNQSPNYYAEWLSKVTDAACLAGEAIIALAHAMSEQVIPILQQLDRGFYEYYQAIGSPCGKGKRGYHKWLKSLSDVVESDKTSNQKEKENEI